MKLEIERRFLLKNFNVYSKDIDEKFYIVQHYITRGTDVIRYRHQKSGNNNTDEYFKNIKKATDTLGIREETEINIPIEEFYQNTMILHEKNMKTITKERFLIESYLQKLRFEVDVFTDMKLIIVEVELPSLDYQFTFPKLISEQIILEVTDLKEFSNYNLAITEKD